MKDLVLRVNALLNGGSFTPTELFASGVSAFLIRGSGPARVDLDKLLRTDVSDGALTPAAVRRRFTYNEVLSVAEWSQIRNDVAELFGGTYREPTSDSVRDVYETVVAAAHNINAMCPPNGGEIYESIYEYAGHVARRCRRRRAFPDVYADAARAFGFRYHAGRQFGRAIQTFSAAVWTLESGVFGEPFDPSHLRFAEIDARLAYEPRRSLPILEGSILSLVSERREVEQPHRLIWPQAKLNLLKREYSLAFDQLLVGPCIEDVDRQSRHGQFEQCQMLSIAAAGSKSSEAKGYLDDAEALASEASMDPQLKQVQLLRQCEGNAELMTRVTVRWDRSAARRRRVAGRRYGR